jgi:hypothetical protein
MSKSGKENLGHKRRLTHAQKRRIATNMVSKDPIKPEEYPGVFRSLGWRKRKSQIMQRVSRQKIRAHYYAELRRGERQRQSTGVVEAA